MVMRFSSAAAKLVKVAMAHGIESSSFCHDQTGGCSNIDSGGFTALFRIGFEPSHGQEEEGTKEEGGDVDECTTEK
jgi:thiamine biosynthesis lipoprotein ApbE